VNKKTLLQKIVARLADEVVLYTKAARAAFEEATDEQSRADNKYDTRSLEASYLARGQAQQLADTEQALLEFKNMVLRDLGPQDRVEMGALVELTGKKEKAMYFVGPKAGGTEIEQDGQEVMVITPQSPLGRQIVGRKQGETLQLEVGATKVAYKVTAVS
jgi:transcription elongation GreA/GreB family factor